MSIWCLLDTRARTSEGIDAATRVAGLSLIARHMRRAARQGWAGAVVLADGDTRAVCERALAQEAPPADFTVEYASPDDHGSGAASHENSDRVLIRLDLFAIYDAGELTAAVTAGRPVEPVIAIATRADVRAAERLLYRSIRKSLDQDGVVAFYIFRVLSGLMTRVLIKTPVTPNQVSLTAMAFGISAAVCAALGTSTGLIFAGVLFWLGAVIDCVDGEIARLRVKGSKLGEWLDSMADEVSTFGLLIGLGLGMDRLGFDSRWTELALIGAGVGIVVNAKLYVDLHRAGAAIDTAQYPWFFGEPAAAPENAGLWSNLVRWVGFGFRRDAFVTATAVMLLVGVPHWAIVLLAGGTAFVLIMLLTHLAVMAMRRSSSSA